MRKIAILLAALLLVLAAAAWFLPMGAPGTGEPVTVTPITPTDVTMAAENCPATTRIYTYHVGTLTQVQTLSRLENGRAWRLARAAAGQDGTLYLLRLWEDHPSAWDLLELRGNGAQVLFEGTFELGADATGLTVQGGLCWITALAEDGSVYVYECVSGGIPALKLSIPAQWLPDVVWAQYDGRTVRATDAMGDSYRISVDSGAQVRAEYDETAADSPLPAVSVGLSHFDGTLQCKRQILLATLALWCVSAVIIVISALLCRKGRTLAARMLAAGSCCTLLALLATWLFVLHTILLSRGIAALWAALIPVTAVLAVIWVITLLLLWATARYITRPVAHMTRQMGNIAEGDVAPREVGHGRDELHQMERSMQEMCMSLSIRNYEVDSTLQSFGRFVPQNLTELLDRAVVAEVSQGDSRRVTGSVGLFSVGNRDTARSTLKDDHFVDFINHSFGILYDCVRDSGGVLLSGGLQLASMEAMFPNSPADGVKAGLDFLGQSQKSPGQGIPAPELFLLLHQTSFLYGLSGREERLFPYLSSSELDFLKGYAEKFHEAGARIVVTEPYWNRLEGFTGRYIGFVSDRGRAYKLYEILDPYPELQRNLRIKYDARFQEGLNLFYQNDFYLARNLFSTLVRVCPEDGIARWYLFACEHLFNREETSEPDYSLFGIGT